MKNYECDDFTAHDGLLRAIPQQKTSARQGDSLPSFSRPLHAFTLIELLVVVAIIALLVAILVPSLQQAREQARRSVCGSNLHSVGLSLTMYANVNGSYPSAIMDASSGMPEVLVLNPKFVEDLFDACRLEPFVRRAGLLLGLRDRKRP